MSPLATTNSPSAITLSTVKLGGSQPGEDAMNFRIGSRPFIVEGLSASSVHSTSSEHNNKNSSVLPFASNALAFSTISFFVSEIYHFSRSEFLSGLVCRPYLCQSLESSVLPYRRDHFTPQVIAYKVRPSTVLCSDTNRNSTKETDALRGGKQSSRWNRQFEASLLRSEPKRLRQNGKQAEGKDLNSNSDSSESAMET